MKTSRSTSRNHTSLRWQTLVQTPTDLNSSSRSKKHRGSTAPMLSSVRSSKAFLLLTHLNQSGQVAGHQRRQSPLDRVEPTSQKNSHMIMYIQPLWLCQLYYLHYTFQ